MLKASRLTHQKKQPLAAAAAIVGAVICAGVASAQQSSPTLKAKVPQLYQERLQNASPEIRAKIEALEQRALREKWRFWPTYTAAFDHPMSELGGALPGPSKAIAAAQQASARQALQRYYGEKRRLGIHSTIACNSRFESFDWRSKHKLSEIQKQDPCASCWAFAAASAFEGSYLIENNQLVDASEQRLVNCVPNDCKTGGYLWKALDYLVSTGTDLENDDPYVGKHRHCTPTSAQMRRLVTYSMIDTDWTKVVAPAKIKSALCEHGPIAVRLISTAAFRSLSGEQVFHQVDSGLTVDSDNDDLGIGGHFLNIIGWDDTLGAHGAWLVRNSWGKAWGNGGYGWIEYGANLIGHQATWVHAAHDKVGVGRGPKASSTLPTRRTARGSKGAMVRDHGEVGRADD